MKRLIPMVLLSAAVAGCATSQMKSMPFYSGSERVYTGRVNGEPASPRVEMEGGSKNEIQTDVEK